jgi:hypothetical protein
MDLQSQLAALAPSPDPAASKGNPPALGANGTPVQMKIDLGTLDAKLKSTPEYSGTIDGDTDCATANEVGEAWVGSGASRRTYGPPFAYQMLSADGKRQYRPPMVKQSGKMVGNAQANYEARSGAGARFPFNAHVTVTDVDKYLGEKSGDEQKDDK